MSVQYNQGMYLINEALLHTDTHHFLTYPFCLQRMEILSSVVDVIF